MPTDAKGQVPGFGNRRPNARGEAPPPGQPGQPATSTEPATDLASTRSTPPGTIDWVPSDSASTIGRPAEPASPPPSGFDRIIAERYCLVREIGRGGFGVVWLAYDRELHRQVAVKIASCYDGRGVDHLLEEGRKAALLDHQNIVPVYDCGRINDRTIFIVSKYIDGGSLSRLLALRKLEVNEAVRIAGEIADALSHAHECGLIHRDLKPSNILIDSADRVYVADFGLALRTTDRSDCYCVEGSPLYMSPEQAGGKSRLVDRRTDVFSFGVILYEMLTGKRPFPAGHDGQDHRVQEPPAAHEVCPEVPVRLGQICQKAMSPTRPCATRRRGNSPAT